MEHDHVEFASDIVNGLLHQPYTILRLDIGCEKWVDADQVDKAHVAKRVQQQSSATSDIQNARVVSQPERRQAAQGQLGWRVAMEQLANDPATSEGVPVSYLQQEPEDPAPRSNSGE